MVVVAEEGPNPAIYFRCAECGSKGTVSCIVTVQIDPATGRKTFPTWTSRESAVFTHRAFLDET